MAGLPHPLEVAEHRSGCPLCLRRTELPLLLRKPGEAPGVPVSSLANVPDRRVVAYGLDRSTSERSRCRRSAMSIHSVGMCGSWSWVAAGPAMTRHGASDRCRNGSLMAGSLTSWPEGRSREMTAHPIDRRCPDPSPHSGPGPRPARRRSQCARWPQRSSPGPRRAPRRHQPGQATAAYLSVSLGSLRVPRPSCGTTAR